MHRRTADGRDGLSDVDEASPSLRQRVESAEASLLPDFPIDERAMLVGKPNAGRLIDGVQLPASPAYIRRTPRTMWGSGQTIASLQQAIASFRRDVGYHEMGSTQEELDKWFQWPRSRASARGIVQHSADHRSHLLCPLQMRGLGA